MHWVLKNNRTKTIVDKAGDKSVDMWITCLWICGQIVDNLRQYGNTLRTVLRTGCLNSDAPVFSPKGNSQILDER